MSDTAAPTPEEAASVPVNAREALYDRAVAVAITEQRISTTSISKQLDISFAAASTLIKMMKVRGVIGKPDQLAKYDVLISVQPVSRAGKIRSRKARTGETEAPAIVESRVALAPWASDLMAGEGFAGEGLKQVAAALAGAVLFVLPAPNPTTRGSDREDEPSQESGRIGEGASLVPMANDWGVGDAQQRWVVVRELIKDEGRLLRASQQPLNDVGNAARMKIWFGGDMLFVRDVGWHLWAKTHWERAGGDEYVMRSSQMIGQLIEAEAETLTLPAREEKILDLETEVLKKDPDEYDKADKQILVDAHKVRTSFANRKKQRWDYGKSSGNGGKIKGMIEQLAPHMTVTIDELDANPMVLNVKNGTLHFSRTVLDDWDPEGPRGRLSVEFKPHDRRDLITKMAPVDYQPDYVSPRWKAFVERFMPDLLVREFAQTFHGLGITGLRLQALIYHFGDGANGKSVFIQTIAGVTGQYVQMLPVEALSGDGQRRSDQATPEFARLPGARVVRVSELPKGFKLKEALIKALTGGEPILARHLNKGFFEFQPVFKAVLSSNHKPEIYGTDHGIWRRMNLVIWPVKLEEKEQRDFDEVVAEMVAEGSGVLNWLIEGLSHFIAKGLVAPEAVKVATSDHRSDMDPVARFVTHCVSVPEMTDDLKAEISDPALEPPECVRVYARDMFKAFNQWMEANGQAPWKETSFGRQMGERAGQFGFKRYDKRVRYFAPVCLHDVPAAGDGVADKVPRDERMFADD